MTVTSTAFARRSPAVAWAAPRPINVPAACPYCIEEELERTGRQITDNPAEGTVRCSRCGEEFYVAADGVKTIMQMVGRGARKGLVKGPDRGARA